MGIKKTNYSHRWFLVIGSDLWKPNVYESFYLSLFLSLESIMSQCGHIWSLANEYWNYHVADL